MLPTRVVRYDDGIHMACLGHKAPGGRGMRGLLVGAGAVRVLCVGFEKG